MCIRDRLWHNVLNGRVYYASGEVLAQDNKTVVKVYSIHNRGEWLFRIIALILYFALLATCFIVQLNLGIVPQGISSILCFLGALFIMLFVLSIKENRNKYNNLEVMKDEIIKRVEAINHWEK